MRCLWLSPPPAIPKHAMPSYSLGVHSSVPQAQQRRLAIAQTAQGPKEEVEMNGSDILRALQKASTSKRKTKSKNKKGVSSSSSSSSSVETPKEQSPTTSDCTNVRPLCIKPHWPAKLDELDKRLRELSDAI